MKKTLLGALVVVTAAFFSIACQAAKADIVFDVAVDVANESEVLTAGITHAAVNAAEATQANVTLNGVVFQSGNINDATNVATTGFTSSNAADLNPNSLGDTAEYQRFLGDIDFGGDSGDITIQNLTVGNAYALQIWFVDDRTGVNGGRVTTITSGANSVDLNDQFAIGNFVADTDSLTFTVATSGADPNLTGFQVRDLGVVAVPEPSSLVVLGMGISGLFLRRRRSA